MRTLLLVGSVAAGVLLFIYEFYQNRSSQEETPHGHRRPPMSEEDIIDLDTVEPDEVRRRIGKNRTLPGRDEVCSICLDKLIRQGADYRYCIIALPECGHWFHQKCAIRLLEYHPMCPVCRKSIDGTKLKRTPVRVLQASDVNQSQPVAGSSQSFARSTRSTKPARPARTDGYRSDDDLD